MIYRKKKIFVSIDTNSIKKAQSIINQTQTKKLKIGYKFGLEFLNTKNGRKFLYNFKRK